jgi:hypothetical protein
MSQSIKMLEGVKLRRKPGYYPGLVDSSTCLDLEGSIGRFYSPHHVIRFGASTILTCEQFECKTMSITYVDHQNLTV